MDSNEKIIAEENAVNKETFEMIEKKKDENAKGMEKMKVILKMKVN